MSAATHKIARLLFATVLFLLPIIAQSAPIKNADIVLKGRVVDEEGRPIPKVRAYVAVYEFPIDEARLPPESRSLESSFELSFKNVSRVDISLSAEDYEHLDISIEATNPAADMKTIDGAQHYERTFTLETIRPNAILRASTGRLRIYPDGRYVMMRADNLATEENPDSTIETRRFEDTTTTLTLAHPYIYPHLRSAPGHQPATMIYNDIDNYEVSPRDKVAQLCLAGGDPGDGFIVRPASLGEAKTREFPRNTRTAPAAGYAPCIDIPGETFLATEARPTRTLFFYHKIKGLYGKGRVIVAYDSTNGKLLMTMELLTEPTGGRNLKSENL